MNVRAYIIAAGGANYGSLREACRRVGVEAEVGDDPARIAAATHVILPGVGNAAHAMHALRSRDLDRVLRSLTQPLLGICLGMQLLFERSAEGDAQGLGILPGAVQRLPMAPRWPHMGWNQARLTHPHALFDGIADDDWFYFVHGYAVPVTAQTIASTDHGTVFAAAVAHGHVAGVQFHPEKSASAGRRLLKNFFALV
ncbi:MAG: imidazole glycerol phosphate synthase subunit HisH [Rhodanobacter sp.]|jgi:glutamine amidotransferase|nr:imidazole glycerol phosphate synthase subunit HisH [Rhodanobacter sp.]